MIYRLSLHILNFWLQEFHTFVLVSLLFCAKMSLTNASVSDAQRFEANQVGNFSSDVNKNVMMAHIAQMRECHLEIQYPSQ